MTKLAWSETYNLGHDVIDKEHQGLLLIMQRIKDLITENKMAEAGFEFEVLLNEAQKHFFHEEKLLEKTSYPGLEKHKEYHLSLVSKVMEIRDMCEEMVERKRIEDCFDSMASFLIDDIVSGDLHFKSHLQEAGLIPKDSDI